MKPVLLIFFAFISLVSNALSVTESYLVMEANSARVLLAYNSEKKRPIAGLAKIASAKVVLDWAKASGTKLTTQVVVPGTVLTFGGANPMKLQPGDRISIRDAIYSSMLGADSAAMHALSYHVGSDLLARRQRQGDSHKAFVGEMNQLARGLGMRRTRFASAHGVEQTFRKTHSTAADIARLSVAVIRDSGFSFYIKQKSRKISVHPMNGSPRSFTVANTNQLLGQLGVNGLKTGMTSTAGQCLAINSHKSPLVKKFDDGRAEIRKRDLIVVILGSHDRFGRAKQLIPQGWAAHEQWGAAGYPVSEKKREYIVVPKLP